MSDKDQIKEIVNSVAQLQDLKQWERLENYFVKQPYIDNKALSGEMPAVIPKKRLIDGWRVMGLSTATLLFIGTVVTVLGVGLIIAPDPWYAPPRVLSTTHP